MKYRKKPGVVEAEQFFPDRKPWPAGVEQYTARTTETPGGTRNEWFGWRIETLEGPLEVSPADFIITGVQGERYPWKPDIFEATYEKVED